ncbi:MAG: DUF1573 domain-containing protein [Planctomycetaceae bacterium]|nr:DUF1573 domain-containing protein [Planctomycetaceae bacterium]
MSIARASQSTVLVLLWPLVSGCLPAPASAPAPSQPQASSSERSVDLGKLGPESLPTHTFHITNTTARPIRVTAVEKSCSCQEASVRDGDAIPAGGILEISFALPNDRSGPVGGLLTLRTDADSPELATIRLSLSATLPRRVWTEPSTLRLTRGESASLTIRSDVPGILATYRDCGTVRGHVEVEAVERVPGADGAVESLRLAVRLSPAAPAGLVSDYLSIRFDDSRASQIDVLVQSDGVASGSLPPASQSTTPAGIDP